MKTDNLKEWKKELLNCTQCGFCKEICPIFDHLEWDSSAARGKMALSYGLYSGDIEPDESVLERIYQCTTCADCTRRCPSSTRVVDVIEAARKDIVASGVVGSTHQKIADSIATLGNPFGEEKSRKEVFGEVPHPAKIAYFTGCSAAYRNKETSTAGISILKKLGTDYTLLDEVCCGSVLGRIGFSDDVIRRQAEANIKAIEDTGAEIVLFSCAGCLRMFRKEYPRFKDMSFKAMHFVEWLSEQEFDLKPYNKKVTYHDPCHIGRHLGIYDAPRDLINMIPEIDFVEMKDNRESARCCGGGGGVRSMFPEISRQIAEKRVDQAEIADVLLTTCPFCVNNLKLGVSETSTLEVRDLLELIDEILE
ncbi:(Fe-S)-binding protein [Methanococcoides sp. AM1]|uniref:(Fe-S)-binding protein n=1 Tax=Methanococcoides sp. AM1 TaxID=1201011 RepID=UPI0010827C12|nr:(Fe-S)-binding protein [Methanococcoides sp. AM1]